MKLTVIVICLLLIAGASYYGYLDSQANYRRATFANFDIALVDLATAELKLRNIRGKMGDHLAIATTSGIPFDEAAALAELKAGQDHLDDLMTKFFALERKIKDDNAGELPAWVKDNRSWQTIDAKIKRN